MTSALGACAPATATQPVLGWGHLVLNQATEPRRVGSLKPSAALRLVDLTTFGLRRFGLARAEVIDSDPVHFPVTRQLSAWLFENEPDAQGICWTCRQADEGRAALLFAPHVVALGHGPAGGRQGGVDVFVSGLGFVRRRRVSVPPIPAMRYLADHVPGMGGDDAAAEDLAVTIGLRAVVEKQRGQAFVAAQIIVANQA